MTIDFSATPQDSPTNTQSDSPMFAPVPAWERGKKRRGFGGGRTSRVDEEPRSFAAEPEISAAAAEQGAYAFDPIGPAGSARPTESQPTESVFAGTPSYAGVTARRKGNGAPVAIAAGIILLGGLGAAGWYYTQPHDTGIAELTPGSPTTTTTTTAAAATDTPNDQLAQASTPQAAMPAASAAATATPPATTHSTTTTTTTARSSAPAATHRTVTALARTRSAEDVSSDASAAAPAPPAPPAPTPQAAPPIVSVPPAAQAAPAPVQTAPPATPAAPAPTETPPQ